MRFDCSLPRLPLTASVTTQRQPHVFLIVLLCMLGVAGAASPCSAQTLPPLPDSLYAEPPGPWVPSLSTVGHDVYQIAAAPLQLRHKENLIAVGTSALVLGISTVFDQPAYDHWALQQGPATASMPRHLSALGDLYDTIGPDNVAIASVSGFALSGLALRDPKMTRTSVQIAEAVVLTKLITGAMKGTFGRTRPYAETGPYELDLLAFASEHQKRSFPSGHTSRAFAIASVIAHQYDAWWVEASAYSVAASVGMQRISSGNHWLSDVLLGGAIGYLIGQVVADDHRLPAAGSIRYTPVIAPQRVGLAVRF